MRTCLPGFVAGVVLCATAFAQPKATLFKSLQDSSMVWIGQSGAITLYFGVTYDPPIAAAPGSCRGVKPIRFEMENRAGLTFGEPEYSPPRTLPDGRICDTYFPGFFVNLPVTADLPPGYYDIGVRVVVEDRDSTQVYGTVDSTFLEPMLIKRALTYWEQGDLINAYLLQYSEESGDPGEPEIIRVQVEDYVSLHAQIIKPAAGNFYFTIKHDAAWSPVIPRRQWRLYMMGWVGENEAVFTLEVRNGPQSLSGYQCRARWIDGNWTAFECALQWTS